MNNEINYNKDKPLYLIVGKIIVMIGHYTAFKSTR